MAIGAIIAAASAIAGIASAGAGIMGGPSDRDLDIQRATSRRISKESKKIESQRELQMELEGRRQIRQQIRQMVVARSVALTNATNQGAGQSSGLQGGLSQVAAEGLQNIQGIEQNLAIGRKIFKLNRTITGLQTQFNQASSNIQGDQAMSNALIGIGTSLLGNATQIGNVGASLFGGSKVV